MPSHPPEIVHGLFCETLRQEVSGQTTAVGIWGETCRFAIAPPAVIPTLAFHAFIRNPEHLSYNAKVQINLPGNPAPVTFETPIKGDPSQDSQNINIQLAGIPVAQAGDVVVLVHLDTTPPVEREFHLHVDFQPGFLPLASQPTLMHLKG